VSPNDRPPVICIVGANHLHYELITFCLVNELDARCVFRTDLAAVDFNDTAADRPQVLLFDCFGLDAAELENSLDLDASALPEHIPIALFNLAPEVKPVRLVKQYKIRGIFYKDDSRHHFIKGIQTIQDGSLWLSRKMLSECIRMPLEAQNPPPLSLKKLSDREKTILKSVASGHSNQEIADQHAISVHTVKTHLYKIYRKINVPNRRRAALWFNACPLKFSASTESGNT
jgi:LuxR family transcriptional regulator, positive regulator of biofilm formation